MELRDRPATLTTADADPAAPSGIGILENAIGDGFAAALQSGLRRAALSRPATAAGPRHAATAQPQSRPRAELASRDGLDTQSVLRRFEAALPAVLPAGEGRDEPAPDLSLLVDCAFHILSSAQNTSTGRGAATPSLPPAAGALLLECLAQQALEGQRRRLASDMDDELGASIGLALRRLALHELDAGDPCGHLDAAYAALASAEQQIAHLIGSLRGQSNAPAIRAHPARPAMSHR